MRVFLGWILALGLAVSPAMAGTGGESGGDPAATPNPSAATKPAAGAAAKASADAKSDAANLESEIDELRNLLVSQASQLQEQNDQLKKQQDQMEALEKQLKTENAARENLTASPAPSTAASASMASPTLMAASSSAAAATPQPVVASPAPQGADENPLQLKVGNALITPIGFMDFTGVFRNHNAGGGIGSNFASIPYALTGIGGGPNPVNHLTEARLSMQNSRIGFRVDGMYKGTHFIGYMESDFLGNNPTNVAVSSNSNTLRSRLYWVDVSKDKWEILGGQTWSLITPGRVGISPLPGNIFYSQDIDVNYQAGLVWGRIPELRFVYHPSSKLAVAFALDNQEQYAGGSAGAPTITLPSGAGVAGGVTGLLGKQLNDNTTTVNAPAVFPDVIVKVAFDPSPKYHVEFGGVERQFRLAVNSTAATTSPILHQNLTGGGAFFNSNITLFPGFRFIETAFWSEAGGRYVFGQVPDVIVNANGSLSAISTSSAILGFEYTHKNTLLYSYYSGIYADKNLGNATPGFTSTTAYGYGVPGSLTQNRSIQEATIGFNQTMWRDAKYGAINLMGQYSYLTRDPWGIAAGVSPDNANLHMAYFNLRYTLPGGAPAVSALQ